VAKDAFVYVANGGRMSSEIRLPRESIESRLLKAMAPCDSCSLNLEVRSGDDEDDGACSQIGMPSKSCETSMEAQSIKVIYTS
jgi:hypothetical protein